MQDGGTEAFWARVDDIACARLNAEGKPGPEFAGIRRHAQDLLHRSRGIPGALLSSLSLSPSTMPFDG
jgi:hypothetical protein